ncbi:MAG: hypothetical protein SWO11_23385, partial [Thermodesulfobacteriota bacterium]|nr:hypothetical protein [Thermodesulfobacteriota bacterium]
MGIKRTEEWLVEYEAKQRKWRGQSGPINPDNDEEIINDEPESALSKKIMDYCNAHGYPALIIPQWATNSSTVRRFLPPGWPDCVIFLPNRRVLVLELKAKKGELEEKQKTFSLIFLHFKHEWHKLKTFKRFIEIVYNGGQNEINNT